jgi:TolB-like protein/DNA-binding winged helix-turn-helix (wHTH) protein
MAQPDKPFYDFGPFHLDAAQRLLFRNGELVSLPPKTAETLLVLVRNHGQLVEKHDLMEALWPECFVEEANLAVHISQLRKALGESGEARYIETIPRRGYRFIGRVTNGASASVSEGESRESPLLGSTEAETQVSHVWSSLLSRRLAVLPIAFAVLGAIALFAVLRTGRKINGPVLPAQAAPIHSVAVLPLRNLSGDPGQDYFAEGLTEELITNLAQIRSLRVISHTSVMRFKETTQPLSEIARELGVDAVIEGSVSRSGNQVRVNAQLIRCSTDEHLWAKAYDGTLDNIIVLEKQVALAIVQQVHGAINLSEAARLAQSGTANEAAYDLYLKGRFFWNKRDQANLLKAIGYFEQAIRQDPNYALAHSGLADCYVLLGMEPRPNHETDKLRAEAAAVRAVALDDSLAEVHTSLAGIRVLYDWDWPGAEREFKRAIELNPAYAPAHHWYAVLYLAPQHRWDEAISEMNRALELDPVSPILTTDLGWVYYAQGQYDRAITQYRKSVELAQDFIPAHYRLFQVYDLKGMQDDAVRELEAQVRLMNNDQDARGIAGIYAQSGYHGLLEFMFRWRRAQSRRGNSDANGMAISAMSVGETDVAMDELRRAVANREPQVIYMAVEHQYDGLRSDPRFHELLRQAGLPQ